MAKKSPREPVSYSLLEIKTGAVLETYPDTVENYLIVMEKVYSEAAELARLNRDPENLQKRYWDSFRADRNVELEAMDRLGGSIKSVRYWMALCNSDNALIAMFEAANSYRKLLDADFIEQLKQLRNTKAATKTRKEGKLGRHARLKEYAKENGNPPRKGRALTAWIRRFQNSEKKKKNKVVKDDTIRGDLRFLRL